ncbi:MAG: LPXTG cell wall anchor domain-containing protein [Clostridiales bacterium]|nr:LPXTG cell wall anchor domain-containing protein [Clostridiales bacterium]
MAMLLAAPALILAVVVCWQLHLTGIALTDENASVKPDAEESVIYTADAEESVTYTADAEESVTYTADAEECVIYTADAVDEGDMAVTVTAPEGALPERAELSVTLYDETCEEYSAAGESIGYDADDEETGMTAMDISFLVDGEEAELSEPVKVSIDMSAILPEDADLETVEVSLLRETEDGVEAELVADATDETQGTVDPETGIVEFEAESLSMFTISWKYLAQSGGETDQQTQTSTSDLTAAADSSASTEDKADASGTLSAASETENEIDDEDEGEDESESAALTYEAACHIVSVANSAGTADVEEGEELTVTVTAPEGALPEGAELSVTLYDETSEGFAAAGESIEYDADDEETGMAAMDISFLVDGEEVEPLEPVTVSIDVAAVLPEDADLETVEVSHLCETEDGVEAELVADATDETEGTVDPETGVAEFEVESFSTFTIRWSSSGNGGQQSSTSITATTYIYGTSTTIGSGNTSLTGTSGTAFDLTSSNSDLEIDGYTLVSASITYDGTTYNDITAITVTITNNRGNTTYTYSYTDSSGTYQLYSGSRSQTVTISLYYAVYTVTITATKTDTGYLLTATPSGFTSDNITYDWSDSTIPEGATLVDNGDGTATLTWEKGENGWSESTSDYTDSGSTGVSATIKVTATSSYTDEDSGDTVTEKASDSLTVSSVYVRVYVYVAAYDDDGNLFSDEMLSELGIDKSTLDASGYFPAGEIKLDVSFLSGKNYTTQGAALLTSASDWTDLLAALSVMDTSTLIDMTGMTVDNPTYAIDYSPNADNNVGSYISMAAQDVGYTWGSQHSALFRWNMSTSYGFADQSVRYHLDLRFTTNKITFVTGNNNITYGTAEDGTTIDSRVYITGSTIQDTDNLTVPDGYKFAGYYTDADFTTVWNGVGTSITEDVTVYIKLVPASYIVLNYKVAQGEGTLTAYYEGVEVDAASAAGSTATAANGYEFEGWYYDEECTQKIADDVSGTTLTPTKPTGGWVDGTTYYAKFVPISYDITLQKVDADTGKTTLSGASFTLSRTDTDNEITYYSYNDTNGVSWVSDEDDASTITTGSDGTETIHSLNTGYTYTLTETAAPDGYNLLSYSITFEISGGEIVNAVYGTGSISGVVSVSTDGLTITVTNTAGYELPETGGSGTWPYILIGLLLSGTAMFLLAWRRRRAQM